jgi:hypothetical protein
MSDDGYITPWWQAALLPDRWDICGIEVRALSVWHLYALENLNNAYVCGGPTDRDAAASLILICQRDMAELRALYVRPHARARALVKIHKTLKPLKWNELDAACTDYCLTCMRVPEHLKPGKPGDNPVGKFLSAPIAFHLVLCLCAQYQKTETEAWNIPYSRARCLYDTWREATGDESLASGGTQRRTDEALERKFKEKK